MSSCISSIGTANPEYRIKQSSILQFMVRAMGLDDNNALRLEKLYANSGIDYRYSVIPDFGEEDFNNHGFFAKNATMEPFPCTQNRLKLYQYKAAAVAAAAVRDCLKVFPEGFLSKITHLITVSCTGMHAPGIDIELVEKLGLNRHIERTCINFMGCYGALNALKTADYICRADPDARVLVVCIELCTLHFQKENTLDNWVANSLFSDGAAAVIIENNTNKTLAGSLTLRTFYSEFVPEAHNEMGWYVGNMGFEMKLTSKVAKLIKTQIKPITERLLEKARLSFSDISAFAVHPGGKKILEATEIALGIPAKANCFAYDILRNYGNMSSATVLYVLKKIMEDKDPVDKANIMGFAFGPGLTVECMILQKNGYA
ncbi:type III polyketide synthase [Flavihumibacter sp. R14]|nr:type III polyketide synthase [Flavihumibacter soli]